MIIQKGSNPLFHFQEDSESDERQIEHQNQQKILKKKQQSIQKNSIKFSGKDKFQISQIQRGLFLYHNQDEDYLANNNKKQQPSIFKTEGKVQKTKKKQMEKQTQCKPNKINSFQYIGEENYIDNNLCEEIVFGLKNKNQEYSQQVTSKSMNKMLTVAFSDDEEQNQNKTTDECQNVFKQQESSLQKQQASDEQNQSGISIDSTDQRINQIIYQRNKKAVDVSLIYNVELFARSPIQKKYILKAIVRRDTSGFNMFGPLYHLMASETMKSIIWSKKAVMSSSSNYNFSLIQDSFGEANVFNLGKTKSNFIGSSFNIYQNFYNSKTKTKIKQLRATIVYSNQIMSNTPRKFQVFLVNSGYSYADLQGVTPQVQYSINDLCHIQGNKQKIEIFSNRQPIWSQKLKGYILNFNGRIDKPSIKNFILQKPNTKQQVLMFGKSDDDVYNICISNPLSPFMGLAIALTHFDNKFLCQ